MTTTTTGSPCSENTDPRKLVRQGTDQEQRTAGAPDPSRAPVDGRRPEHALVFASAFAAHLRFIGLDDTEQGDWQDLFASDVSAQLAVVAVEDVAVYRTTLKALLRSLEDPDPAATELEVKADLGAVFDCLGTLASRLDAIAEGLPPDQQLQATLGNLIRSQLSPMLQELIGSYVAGEALGLVDRTIPPRDDVQILGTPLQSFAALIDGPGLSSRWPEGVGDDDWATYVDVDPTLYEGGYGPSGPAIERINRLATHNLFTAICETFLGVYARVVDDAGEAFRATLRWGNHEPHYALLLAFVQLLEHARAEANRLTAAHLDLYYRRVLQLEERGARPAHAHVLVELAKHVDAHLVAEGARLKAGKDATGADAHFAVDRDLVANRASVADLKRVYRHPATQPLPDDHDRIFATPSIDTGEPWAPFAEKVHRDGDLTSIDMPHAEVGFAIASHHLWMAEGTRRIEIVMGLAAPGGTSAGAPDQLRCRLTTADGWIEKTAVETSLSAGQLRFHLDVTGDDPPITPYDPATHGFGFATGMPVLVVTLPHEPDTPWSYAGLEDLQVTWISVDTGVEGLRTVALANDHGPVDASKPFLAYGSAPLAGSALLIGSKEVMQKAPDELWLELALMSEPAALASLPGVTAQHLAGGVWSDLDVDEIAVTDTTIDLGTVPAPADLTPDLGPDEPYSTSTRSGFVRLVLDGGFGTDTYPLELAKWIAGLRTGEPVAPVLPTIGSLSLAYTAHHTLDLDEPSEGGGRLFHVTPFGHTPQARQPSQVGVPLLPRFTAGAAPAEGELYLGLRGLVPPQDLALLFQVVDGTADPLVVKPDDHIVWTYLRGDEWVPFAADAVGDGTDGLITSGIVTLAVPADASTDHTLLPAGLHWVRLAVASTSDAVCRLVTVAAQALEATAVVRGDGGAVLSDVLPPGTITKLDVPDAAVKGVDQPFPTFGGRAPETTLAFATRVSERLRHKDRAIALWDHERLVLEAFPAVYQARCLNHTQYEPSASGTGTYRELAPGHVTIVTIPDLAGPDPRNPLRPSTSLGVLGEIERFLAARMSCFTRLHVRNPQFEEVRVDLRVRLRPGFDETFHVNQLKREITEHLSPWAFRGGARPSFDGTVAKSVVVDFVEGRPYVDYVTDVRLFHRLPGATVDGPDLDVVHGSRAISILVSTPADHHGIHPIHPSEDLRPESCACAPVGA
ncbi:MAG TPA: baseplate J/gp47 family protein [Iamia sp.]